MKIPKVDGETGASARRVYRMTARAVAVEKTGQAIVDAAFGRLLVGHYDDITLSQIAGDADVTVQTVLRRFGSKDGLFEAVFAAATSAVTDYREEVEPGDVDQVIARVLDQYEYDGDAVIRLLGVEGRVAVVGVQMETGRRQHRDWLESVFAEVLPTAKLARSRQLARIVVATDVYTWKILRRDLTLSLAETRRAMTEMLQSVLETDKSNKSARKGNS